MCHCGIIHCMSPTATWNDGKQNSWTPSHPMHQTLLLRKCTAEAHMPPRPRHEQHGYPHAHGTAMLLLANPALS